MRNKSVFPSCSAHSREIHAVHSEPCGGDEQDGSHAAGEADEESAQKFHEKIIGAHRVTLLSGIHHASPYYTPFMQKLQGGAVWGKPAEEDEKIHRNFLKKFLKGIDKRDRA